MNLPTASKLQLAMSCPASAMLPREPRPASASAKRGTTLHEVIRAGLLGLEPPKTRIRCKPDIDALRFYLGPGTMKCEATFALNAVTERSRFVGVDLDRNYDAGTGEIFGTTDVAVDGDHEWTVVDYKTGKSPAPPAADNWQLRFFAACLGDATRGVRGAVGYLAQDGSWRFDEHVWTPVDCARIRAELCTAWTAPKVVASPSFANCRWCECICDDRDAMTMEAF